MENWENRKYFNFSNFCLVESEKVDGQEKMNLYKFTHIWYTLVKKWWLIKIKKWQTIRKKKKKAIT